jgi:hypothetical protein
LNSEIGALAASRWNADRDKTKATRFGTPFKIRTKLRLKSQLTR